MTIWPFVKMGSYDRSRNADGASQRSREAAAMIRLARDGCAYCRAITGQSFPEHVWHLAFHCLRPGLIRARERMFASVTRFLTSMCRLLYRLVDEYRYCFVSYSPAGPDLKPTFQAIVRALETLSPDDFTWDSDAGHVLVYRLLLVLPFPDSLTTGFNPLRREVMVSHALGTVFQTLCLPRRYLKHLSNMWARWSHKWLIEMGDVRSGRTD